MCVSRLPVRQPRGCHIRQIAYKRMHYPSQMQGPGFLEFLQQPENQRQLEKHFRDEAKQAVKMEERERIMRLRQVVMQSSIEAQKNIGPFLKTRPLRRIIQTFANDPNGDFEKWACNPAIIQASKHLICPPSHLSMRLPAAPCHWQQHYIRSLSTREPD